MEYDIVLFLLHLLMCAYIISNLCCLLMPQNLSRPDDQEEEESQLSQHSQRSPQKQVKHLGKGKKTPTVDPLEESLAVLIKSNVENSKKVV